jgi:hypothetical protein
LVGGDGGGGGIVGIVQADAAVGHAAGDGEVGLVTSIVGRWEGGAGAEGPADHGVAAHLGGAGEVFAVAEREVEVRHGEMRWTGSARVASIDWVDENEIWIVIRGSFQVCE